MSTKREPGAYDCYAKLAVDEPYFVLRAKDPNVPALVELWAALRLAQYGEYPKLEEARNCAVAMRAWKAAHPEAKPTIPVQSSAESETVARCVDHWFTQGGRAQYGELGEPSNPDELVSAILERVRGVRSGP